MPSLSSKFVLVVLAITLAAAPTFAAAANAKRTMPPTCLRAATSLCTGSSTNAMTCLKNLVKEGDSRVSQACTSALTELAEQSTASKPTPADRAHTLGRLLTEGATCTTAKTLASPGAGLTNVGFGVDCANVCCNSPGNGACCRVVSGTAYCYAANQCGCC